MYDIEPFQTPKKQPIETNDVHYPFFAMFYLLKSVLLSIIP